MLLPWPSINSHLALYLQMAEDSLLPCPTCHSFRFFKFEPFFYHAYGRLRYFRQSLFLKSFLAFGRRRRLVLPPRSVWAVPFLPPVTFKRRCQTEAGSAIWSPLDNTRDSVLVMADTVDTFSKHCVFQVNVEPRGFSRSHTCVVLRCYTLQCVVYVCVCVFFS